MPHLATILALLVASPVTIFVLHAIIHRILEAANRHPTAHASALRAIVGTLVLLCGSTWWLAMPPGASLGLLVCTAAYVVAVYLAIAVLYLDVVNIAETSLHMHLLLELAWNGSQPVTALQERYSAEQMLAARLDRLAGIGQLQITDGRYHVGDRTALRIAFCVDLWRIVLGLPTTPEAADASAR